MHTCKTAVAPHDPIHGAFHLHIAYTSPLATLRPPLLCILIRLHAILGLGSVHVALDIRSSFVPLPLILRRARRVPLPWSPGYHYTSDILGAL